MPLVCVDLGVRQHTRVEGSWGHPISLWEALEAPPCFKDEETEARKRWVEPSSPVSYPATPICSCLAQLGFF